MSIMGPSTGDPFATNGGDYNPAKVSDISSVIQQGIGSVFGAGLNRLAFEISPTANETSLQAVKQEAERQRQVEQQASTANTKSIYVAVGAAVVGALLLMMLFRK